jgi:energy-converting hydrogenase Eha subunit H
MIAAVLLPFGACVLCQAFKMGGITLLAVLLLFGGIALLVASDR